MCYLTLQGGCESALPAGLEILGLPVYAFSISMYLVTSGMLTPIVTLKNGNNQQTDIEVMTKANKINGLDNKRVIKTLQNVRTNPLRHKANSRRQNHLIK